jgi:hypothetical protein
LARHELATWQAWLACQMFLAKQIPIRSYGAHKERKAWSQTGCTDALRQWWAYGFFISSEDDRKRYAPKIVKQDLKVMKQINHLPGTIEGGATRHGTLVGPVIG